MHKGRHTNMHTDTFNRRWSYKAHTVTEGGLSIAASQNFNANTNDALDNEIS